MASEPSTNDDGCPKCGHTDAEVGSISTTGGGLSKMFDIQTNKFRVVSCTSCGYSELYRDVGSSGSDLVDVFFG
ncbi:zinc ribbon domain-containing protein [Halorarum halobium]|uniref:zinc ribbon domain-containing protein n=1 Tax=Halorarum halobium TaxID=3075121 RepID=UPI0028A7F66A|nr:zinc ribbon domain-containing protein [Halobaculum sp. XH14]